MFQFSHFFFFCFLPSVWQLAVGCWRFIELIPTWLECRLFALNYNNKTGLYSARRLLFGYSKPCESVCVWEKVSYLLPAIVGGIPHDSHSFRTDWPERWKKSSEIRSMILWRCSPQLVWNHARNKKLIKSFKSETKTWRRAHIASAHNTHRRKKHEKNQRKSHTLGSSSSSSSPIRFDKIQMVEKSRYIHFTANENWLIQTKRRYCVTFDILLNGIDNDVKESQRSAQIWINRNSTNSNDDDIDYYIKKKMCFARPILAKNTHTRRA